MNDPKPGRPRTDLTERFEAKVIKTDTCWLWPGNPGSKIRVGRVGSINALRSRSMTPKRLSWEIANGPVPDGVHVIRRCASTQCVNPAHLILTPVVRSGYVPNMQATGGSVEGESQGDDARRVLSPVHDQEIS